MHFHHGARGVVVSHPLSMREALGSIPSVSMVGKENCGACRVPPWSTRRTGSWAAFHQGRHKGRGHFQSQGAARAGTHLGNHGLCSRCFQMILEDACCDASIIGHVV